MYEEDKLRAEVQLLTRAHDRLHIWAHKKHTGHVVRQTLLLLAIGMLTMLVLD